MQRIHNVLLPKGLNIADLIMKNGKGDNSTTASHNLLLCATLQIFIVDVFKVLEIKASGVHGIFSGEFVKGYFDGVLTLEQTVLGLFHLARLTPDVKSEFLTPSQNRKRIIIFIFDFRTGTSG